MKQTLLLISDPLGAGVLLFTGQNQSFLRHGFQQTLVGTGKVFALFLTEFADNLVAQFTVKIKKSIILIPKTGSESKLAGIVFVVHICLVALQQSIKLANEFVSRLILLNILCLPRGKTVENFLEPLLNFQYCLKNQAIRPALMVDFVLLKPISSIRQLDTVIQSKHSTWGNCWIGSLLPQKPSTVCAGLNMTN